jgi:hypothetical protein
MKGDVDNFHHLGVMTADIEATVRHLERLGFKFAPLSVHKFALQPGAPLVALGTGNRCAIFRKNFLEIVGVIDPAQWDNLTKAQRGPYDIDAYISRYQGLHIMIFNADEIGVTRARFIKNGVPCSEISRIERNVDTPDGQRMMTAQTVHFPPGTNPEGGIQIASHLTPELVLQPRYMDHANGATGLTECIVCDADPAPLAAKYERYTGHPAKRIGNLLVIDLGYARIVLVEPKHLGELIPGCVPPVLPFLAGFAVATTSLDAARGVLRKANIPFIEHGGRVIVRPEHAQGSAVIFEREGATRTA